MHSTFSQGNEGSRKCPLIRHADCEGPKERSLTFLATIASSGEENGNIESLPLLIEKVLEENKEVMADKLPKTLPSRFEVDHKIELEVGAKPPMHAPYHMDPPKIRGAKEEDKGDPRGWSHMSI